MANYNAMATGASMSVYLNLRKKKKSIIQMVLGIKMGYAY